MLGTPNGTPEKNKNLQKNTKTNKTALAFRVPQERNKGNNKMFVINAHYQQKADEYKNHLEMLGYNKKSVRNKYLMIIEFLKYLETGGINNLERITEKEIVKYHSYLKTRPNKTYGGILSLKTVASNMWNVKLFFTMLQTNNEIKTNPASLVKYLHPESKTNRTILTREEIEELYSKTKTREERAILALGYGCGLRASEISQLNTEDVKINRLVVVIKSGKGNKRRVVPMSPGVKRNLNEYYFTQRIYYKKNEHAFLLNNKERRMKPYTCNNRLKEIISRCSNRIKEKNISMHNLRHSIATHLLEDGITLEQLRDFLGHSKLESTEIYTRVNQEQIKLLTEK